MLVMLANTGSIFSTAEFWVAAAFVLFIGLLVYYKVPGLITKALDERADAIRRELDEARRLREEAQQLLNDYQRKRREAEDEANAIIEQAKREAEALAAETRQSLKESLARRTKLAEEKIARAEAQALNEVRAAAVDAAIAAAERIIRQKVTPEVNAQLVDQGIVDVKRRLN
ncbi:MAG: F0F1 ATP synthase subunit B [Hyphomicrobiaceae bacterium]|jgi:ATP synthase, F0 subunit b